jgi:hypothetical protein
MNIKEQGLKQKLVYKLSDYLLKTNNSYLGLYMFFETLKQQYTKENNSDLFQVIEHLRSSISNYEIRRERLTVSDWLINVRDSRLIKELITFVDVDESRFNDFEEKIQDIQIQLNEIKQINLCQNSTILKIDENTSNK